MYRMNLLFMHFRSLLVFRETIIYNCLIVYSLICFEDLGLFSTKALLEAHADHEVEVRTQVSSFYGIVASISPYVIRYIII